MKIRNFNINPKITTKLSSYILVASLLACGLSACRHNASSQRSNILKGTFLENTCVVTFEDGSKDIAVAISSCAGSKYNHYYSVITGEYFGDSEQNCVKEKIDGTIIHHYPIVNEENIIGYLTEDVLLKVVSGKLTNEELISFISQTITPNEEVAEKVK